MINFEKLLGREIEKHICVYCKEEITDGRIVEHLPSGLVVHEICFAMMQIKQITTTLFNNQLLATTKIEKIKKVLSMGLQHLWRKINEIQRT